MAEEEARLTCTGQDHSGIVELSRNAKLTRGAKLGTPYLWWLPLVNPCVPRGLESRPRHLLGLHALHGHARCWPPCMGPEPVGGAHAPGHHHHHGPHGPRVGLGIEVRLWLGLRVGLGWGLGVIGRAR